MPSLFQRCALVLCVVGACKGSDSSKPAATGGSGSAAPSETAAGSADPFEDTSFSALEKVVAINEMFHDAKTKLDPASWPTDKVEGLDFQIDGGNAVIAYRPKIDLADTIQDVPPFKLYHVEDDPYRAAQYYRGNGLDKAEDKAKFHADKYKPAVQAMARAKYALLVVDKTETLATPRVNTATKEFTPGTLDAVALLYEIESKKLLGGFTVKATNGPEVTTHTGNYTGEELDAVMFDFEKNAMAAMQAALTKRFPSAKPPHAVYLDGRD